MNNHVVGHNKAQQTVSGGEDLRSKVKDRLHAYGYLISSFRHDTYYITTPYTSLCLFIPCLHIKTSLCQTLVVAFETKVQLPFPMYLTSEYISFPSATMCEIKK